MAVNITNIKSGDTVIKHGSVTVNIHGGTGSQNYDGLVFNTPVLADISEKYTDRFDDPTYYG